MGRLFRVWVVLAIGIGSMCAQAPQGQPDYGQGQSSYDPGQQSVPNPEQSRPDQGIARISLLNGEVSVRRGDSGDVIAAAMNAPLLVQDRLLTSSAARAEIQFDSVTMLRVGANSEVRIADLQYGHAQLQLAIGTITLRILRNSQEQIEIDLPAVGFRPSQPGVYRISVREDGSGDITVRDGAGQVLTQGGAQDLKAGYTMMVRGAAADAEYQIVTAVGLDDWDRWNQQRDGAFLQSRSAQYVSPDVYGTENLDQNGRWVQDPTYGNVWAPNVAPGWAPYQAGQWVWEDYYGWTWVSTDPWGWAPYHYGRWFYGPVGWAWYPGPLYARHYWAPALVGFFGFGGLRVGVGFGFANVGWVALAPFEVFHSWWGHGYSRGAIFNNVSITNVYRNARVANGVTAVGAGAFGHRAVPFQRLSGAQVQNAGMVGGALPVTPSRSSLSFSNRAVNGARFPQSANRSFFGRGSAAGTQRTSFETAQRGFAQSAAGVAERTNNAGGWSRFNGPTAGAPAARGTNPAPQSSYRAPSNSGWGGGSRAVRISPPIVRNYSSGPSRGGSTAAYRSAPAARSSGNESTSRKGGSGVAHPSSGGHAGGGGHHR